MYSQVTGAIEMANVLIITNKQKNIKASLYRLLFFSMNPMNKPNSPIAIATTPGNKILFLPYFFINTIPTTDINNLHKFSNTGRIYSKSGRESSASCLPYRVTTYMPAKFWNNSIQNARNLAFGISLGYLATVS